MGRYVDGLVDFSVDGSQLRTCRGVLPLPGASDSLSQPLSTVSADLAVIEGWATWNMARALWIPHGYRFEHCFVAGNVVVSVTQSGLPIWIELDPSKRPTGEALVNRFTWVDATDYEIHT